MEMRHRNVYVSDLNINVNCMQMSYEHMIMMHMQIRDMQMRCEYADEVGRMDMTEWVGARKWEVRNP